MLPPRVVRLMLRHFDSVDECVARRLMRKRPWSEPALTSYLCDVLDADTQSEEPLSYPLEALNRDLLEPDGVFDMAFSVETREYEPAVERWVTQADLGFVLSFQDFFDPSQSWQACWLLQAKRLYPMSRSPLRYTESCTFGGRDPKQHQRIEKLQEVVGMQFVKYLLYCPRPAALDDLTRGKLAYLRSRRFANNIFDYTLGLEVHEELSVGSSTLAAGLWIADPSRVPPDFAAVHADILNSNLPLAWFIVSHFFDGQSVHPMNRQQRGLHPDQHRPMDADAKEWACGIVRGDSDAVERLVNELEETDDGGAYPVLPSHTLIVTIGAGHRLNPNLRESERR